MVETVPQHNEAPNNFPVSIDDQGKKLMEKLDISPPQGNEFMGNALVDTENLVITAEGPTLVVTETTHGQEFIYRGNDRQELNDNMLFVGMNWALESGKFENVRPMLQADLAKILARHPEWK